MPLFFKHMLKRIPFKEIHDYISHVPPMTLFYVFVAIPVFTAITIAILKNFKADTPSARIGKKAREQLAERSFQKMQKEMMPPHKSA